jgi:hypothetical protein
MKSSEKLRLESLKDFSLNLNSANRIRGGASDETEQCTTRCPGQYDCVKDDGHGETSTDAEFDNCED